MQIKIYEGEGQRSFLQMEGKENRKVYLDEIYYGESQGRKIKVYCVTEKVEFYSKLDDLEQILPDNFLRCHKSFFVNMQHVRCVDWQDITMMDGKKVPVGRRQASEARKKIFLYFTSLMERSKEH